jgi:hypothetical protein
MWLVVGLGLMGLLVGMLAGMSSSIIVQPLIALLFAFVGGSVFAILSKLSGEDRMLAGKMVSALSLCCLIGAISGMVITRHQYLVPADIRADVVKACLGSNPPPACLLRSSNPGDAAIIDQKKNAGKITADEAYNALRELYQQDHSAAEK